MERAVEGTKLDERFPASARLELSLYFQHGTSLMPHVREFQSNEWELYRALRLAALRESPDAFGSTLAREAAFPDEEWITRLAAGSSSSLNFPIVAHDDDGRAVGLAWVRIEPTDLTTATLYQVWVDPDARRRHIGMALLTAALRWAREAAAQAVALHVATGDNSAIQFYRRAGFVESGACSALRPGSERMQQPMQLLL